MAYVSFFCEQSLLNALYKEYLSSKEISLKSQGDTHKTKVKY